MPATGLWRATSQSIRKNLITAAKKKLKIATILGARPQFIKAAPVSKLIREKYREKIREILVHTGQHHDPGMSEIFFRELRIPRPEYHLGVRGGGHGEMTGRMMQKIEKVLQKERPDWVLVYGDTNSTLAGALAAAKLHIPVAHVEAGLRSYNRRMPEEINRILTDRVASLLFCPTRTAIRNLKKEGITRGVRLCGDVMFDAARAYRKAAMKIPLRKWGLSPKSYVFCTIHRQENTDNVKKLKNILEALATISRTGTVVFAVHPRTRKTIASRPPLRAILGKAILEKELPWTKNRGPGLLLLQPLGYLETQRMVQSAKVVLTDSGGLQKEALFHGVPCVTLRSETEWVETVQAGWNRLCGPTAPEVSTAIEQAARNRRRTKKGICSGNGSQAVCAGLLRSRRG